jgi:single-strand DNA-binding protein
MANPVMTLIGRLGQDPEALPNGGMRLRVVSNDRVKNEVTGQWEDKDTSWYTVKLWRKNAEDARNILRKGQEVVIYGRQREESWIDKSSGQERRTYEITADFVGVTLHSLNKQATTATASTREDIWAN